MELEAAASPTAATLSNNQLHIDSTQLQRGEEQQRLFRSTERVALCGCALNVYRNTRHSDSNGETAELRATIHNFLPDFHFVFVFTIDSPSGINSFLRILLQIINCTIYFITNLQTLSRNELLEMLIQSRS